MEMRTYIRNLFVLFLGVLACSKEIFTRKSKIYEITFAIILFVSLTFSLILSALHKLLIYLILKIRFGRNFVGFIDGANLMYTLQGCENTAINFVCSLRTKKSAETLYRELRCRMWEVFRENPTFMSVRKTFLAYDYHLRQDVHLDEVFTELNFGDGVLKGENLLAILQEHCLRKPFARDNTFNTDFTFISTPFDRNEEGDKFYMILRIDHSVCDIISLYASILKLFNANMNTTGVYFEKYLKSKNKLKAILKYPTIKSNNSYTIKRKSKQSNILAIFNENKQGYLNRIKRIKNSYSVSMNSVITTALAASISYYFRSNNEQIPDWICWSSPAQMQPNRFTQHIQLLREHGKLLLGNDYTIRRLRVPMPTDHAVSIDAYLKVISRELKDFSEGLDAELYYAVTRICLKLWPSKLSIGFWSNKCKSTVLCSMVPYGNKLELQDGTVMEDTFLSISPNNGGISIVIVTYDGKLHITISGKESIFTPKELDGILNRMLFYIDALYDETLQ